MDMRLSEFADAMRKDVAKFESDWLRRRQLSQKQYPLEMDDGEWYEHFLIWMSMQEGT